MASPKRKTICESIFGVFYVMTEGDFPSGGTWKFRFTVALLLIDFLQVLRSLAVSTFLWSDYSISIMRSVDLVSLFFHTVQQIIPEWVFFGFAMLVAIGGIINAGYVMKVFRAGDVKIIWPLKILRMLVASIVTVFFTTVLEFLIYPVRCMDISHEDNFSSVLHGSARPCNPWDVPEISFSIPTILVAVAFISFSLLTTFLDFTINPLCRHPLAQCTGRLESLWTLFKVAALLLVYLAPFVSAMACAVILFLLSVVICFFHFSMLPFHNEGINMVRGGIYLSVFTFCLASIIVQHYPDRQDLQNWMLGASLVAFFLGMFIVSQIVNAVNRYLGVLRGQWDDSRAKADGPGRGGRGRKMSIMSEATQLGGAVATERSMHEQFFDVKWEEQRRFTNGSVAYLAARILLQRRNQDEMMFLLSLLAQCLKDHPNSHNLSMFHLLVLRYVFKERNQAVAQEKLSKMQSSTVALDRSYILFAVNKKTVQEGASESLGKGSISAVNLMEFDQRMDVARRSHRECVVTMKSFWKHVAKRRRATSHDAPERALKMTDEVEKFTKAMEQARQEYAWLYEKYPSSAALLSSYANFCDHVLNDTKKADQLRQQLTVMEAYGDVDELTPAMNEPDKSEDIDDALGNEMGQGLATGQAGTRGDDKSVSTDMEPYRVQMARYMQSWSPLIMSRDADMIKRLHVRVKGAIFFLLALSTTSFIVTDFVLFNDVALKTIRDIAKTGEYRILAATAPYRVRNQLMAARDGDEQAHAEIRDTLISLTKTMQENHYATYEQITTSAIQDFYEDPSIKVNMPRPTGWEHELQSFRQLGYDFARRVASAASTTIAEHLDSNYELDTASKEKRDIAYLFENMIRYVRPSFDDAVTIYGHQMNEFGRLTTTITTLSACLTGLLVVAIAVNVLRARAEVIKRVHSNRVSISLALELPRRISLRFYKYYSEVELDMAIMEDEAQARDRITEEADFKQRASSAENMKRRPSMSSIDFPIFQKPGQVDMPRGTSLLRGNSCDSTRRNSLRRSESLLRTVSQNPSLTVSTKHEPEIEVHSRVLRSPVQMAVRGPDMPSVEKLRVEKLTADNLQFLIEHLPSKDPGAMSPRPLDSKSQRNPNPRVQPELAPSPCRPPELDQDEDDSWNEEGRGPGGSGRGSGSEMSNALFHVAVEVGCEEPAEEEEVEEEEERACESRASGDESDDSDDNSGNNSLFNSRKAAARPVGLERAPSVAPSLQRVPSEEQGEDSLTKAQRTGVLRQVGEEEQAEELEQETCEESTAQKPEGDSELVAPPEQQPEQLPRKTILRQDSLGHTETEDIYEDPPAPIVLEESSMHENSSLSKTLRFSASSKGFHVAAPDKEKEKGTALSGFFKGFMHSEFKKEKEETKEKKEKTAAETEGLEKVPEEKKEATAEADEEADGKQGKEPGDLEPQDMQPEMQEALAQLQYKGQPWFNRFHVYVMTLTILLVLCMFYSLYPALRRVPAIVTMAPTMDMATRRLSLSRACIFLARELVMPDGLSRMTVGELSGTLDAFITDFENVDRAVRLGDKQRGILTGADHRSNIHNQVMYRVGCPWRQNPEKRAVQIRRSGVADGELEDPSTGAGPEAVNCRLPASGFPTSAENGLFNLVSTFLDAAKAILLKHGSDPSEYVNVYNKYRVDGEDVSEFTRIAPSNHTATMALLENDPNLQFLQQMFDGDLYDGLNYVVWLFEQETQDLLDYVHIETRLLFGIYIAFLLLVFYSSLFMKTLEAARTEVSKAQEFAHTVPLHVLEGDEAPTVKAFYMRDNGMAEESHEADGVLE